MPPFGQDDKTHAMHALSALDAAKALIAAIASSGGIEKASMEHPDVRAATRLLFTETSKLQVFEARARARGTLTKLDDAQLAQAIQDVRQKRVLSAGEQETLTATPDTIDEMFSLDEAPPAPAPAALPAPAVEPAPASGPRATEDAFAL